MRKIDYEMACKVANDLWNFCNMLHIKPRDYDENICTLEGALEKIEEMCEYFIKDRRFDDLRWYLTESYLPNEHLESDDTYYMIDDQEKVQEFDFLDFKYFKEEVLRTHIDDDDWDEEEK